MVLTVRKLYYLLLLGLLVHCLRLDLTVRMDLMVLKLYYLLQLVPMDLTDLKPYYLLL